MKIKDLAAALKNYDEDTPIYIFISEEKDIELKATSFFYDADENKFWIEGFR